MNAITISIPKPCHEDWDKMTPNEKGAHCAVCQKTVIDFSTKSDAEIISMFEKKTEEKVCGRFAPSQLSRPVVKFREADSTNTLAKFVYALLLVFGAALFNQSDAMGQTVKGEVRSVKMGKVAIRPIEPAKPVQHDTVVKLNETPPTKCGLIIGDTIMETTISGEVVVEPAIGQTMISEISEPLASENASVVEENNILTGANEMIISVIDPIIIDSEYVSSFHTTMLGLVAIEVVPPETNETIIVEETPETKENNIPESNINFPDEPELIASPNPSTGKIVLNYQLTKNALVHIDIYDITGKIIKTLSHIPRQYAGIYNEAHDISDLPNGIYIVSLQVNDKKTSIKIILQK